MDALIEHQPSIDVCISDFDIKHDHYQSFTPSQLGIEGDDSNVIFIKGNKLPSAINISFSGHSKNCRIFIGSGIFGVGSRFVCNASGNVIYIGNKCGLKKVSLTAAEDNDIVIIGSGVTTTSKNIWTTGHHSGKTGKAIIIGDDCMLSFDVSIRASDGHPVFSTSSMKQLNSPKASVVIEPHCWIGQGAMILKDVRIGACSIIAASTVVTKSSERFSLLLGAPSTSRPIDGKIWGRNNSEEARAQAKYWSDKFSSETSKEEKKTKGKNQLISRAINFLTFRRCG